MKCIMVHILRYLKILIIFLLAFPVLAEEPTITNAPMATGLVVASCNTLESITELAHLDKESTEEAKILFNYLRMNGKCGTYGKFIIVFLEKLEFSYIDNSDGEVIEVWKLYNQELWSLVRKSNVKLLGLTI